ncbi:ABC transporter substrate-binding protein [Actinocorallia sp. A-T 12471]|uniref:ABC transporter substrate-binding protein n=1 Tax=Actinocorallia sp. A-T 12471 TaxID=3089813 RepID=UPI0029CEA45A|nr:ABC transporter substrate-binding protein [Actinocorallia sp. A-T 12471]MDX6741070.1 ABC transporter substrate-binding protein [Actinocorallia sp. A-T 12471]
MPTKKLTRLSAALSAGVLALALTACGGDEGDSSLPTVRFAVGADVAFSPLYVADEEGIFAKHGVNVELVKTEGGPAPTQSVAAGAAHMGANADPTVLGNAVQSKNLRAIAVFQQSDRYIKVVLRDGITDPKQIKSMAVVDGSPLMGTVRYLESQGVDRSAVKFVKSSAPEIPALLKRGDVDGFVLYEPWPSRAVADGAHVVAVTGDFGMWFHQWVVADDKWLAANPDTAADVVAAIAEADELIGADPQRAAEATQKAIKLPVEQSLSQFKEIDYVTRGFTDEDLASYKTTVEFFTAEKLWSGTPDLAQVVLKDWYGEHVAK